MRRSILSTLFLVVVAVVAVAQQKQDALYIYRNDGGFNAFFYADIDRIEYSCIDTAGVEHDEYVVQEIYALDSVFRIPISAIDSVGFVTPETKYKNDVKATTESDFWSYVIGSDTINKLQLRKDIPQRLIPVVGDKLVTTKSREYLPHGFYGKVLSVINTDEAINVVCEIPQLTELFDKWVCKVAACSVDDNNEVKNDAPQKAPTPFIRVPLPSRELHFNLHDYKASDGNITIQGSAFLHVTFSSPDLQVRAFIDVDPAYEKGIHYDAIRILKTQRSYQFNLNGKIEASRDFPILSDSFLFPGTPFTLETEAGVSLSASAEGEFFSSRTQLTDLYTTEQYNNSFYDYDPTGDAGSISGDIHDIYSYTENRIKGKADLSVSIYCFTGLSLITKDILWAGVRYDAGGRLELSMDMDAPNDYFAPLHEELPSNMVSSPTLLYDQLNIDGSAKFTPFCTGKIELSVGTYNRSHVFHDDDLKRYEWSGGMVPEFYDTEAFVANGGRTVNAHTNLRRQLLFREDVGFAAYFLENNKLAGQAWNVFPYDGFQYANPEMSLSFTPSGPGNLLRVFPVLKMPIFGYELLCSPYVDVVIPPVIEIDEDTLHAEKGATKFQVEVKTNCKDIGVWAVIYDNNYDWIEVSLAEPTQDFDKRILTIDVAQNKTIFKRSAKIILYATAGEMIAYDTLYVKQQATPLTNARVYLQVVPGMIIDHHQEGYIKDDRHPELNKNWNIDTEEYNSMAIFQTPAEGVLAQCTQNGDLLTLSGSFDLTDNSRGINESSSYESGSTERTYNETYVGSFTVMINLSEYGGRLVNCKAQMRWDAKETEAIIRKSRVLNDEIGWYWYTQERENTEDERIWHYSVAWRLNVSGYLPSMEAIRFETRDCGDGDISALETWRHKRNCDGYEYDGRHLWNESSNTIDSYSSSSATTGYLSLIIAY